MMKDKLVKHHHKFSYFVIRRIMVLFIAVACVGTAIAVPTYISLNPLEVTNGKAEEVKNDNDDSSTSSNSLDDNK